MQFKKSVFLFVFCVLGSVSGWAQFATLYKHLYLGGKYCQNKQAMDFGYNSFSGIKPYHLDNSTSPSLELGVKLGRFVTACIELQSLEKHFWSDTMVYIPYPNQLLISYEGRYKARLMPIFLRLNFPKEWWFKPFLEVGYIRTKTKSFTYEKKSLDAHKEDTFFFSLRNVDGTVLGAGFNLFANKPLQLTFNYRLYNETVYTGIGQQIPSLTTQTAIGLQVHLDKHWKKRK